MSGQCQCGPGLVDCGDVCADLSSDPQNCGHDCGAGAECVSGTCSCPTGTTDCGGECVSLQTDPLNCGDCGNTCDRNELCVRGHCKGYEPAPTCTTCPCDVCGNNQCCTYGGPDDIVCVEGNGCPPAL